MKNYKMILNIGLENENIKYFDRLTKNKLNDLLNNKGYIILYYDKFLKKYVLIDSKITGKQKEIFDNNIKEYCYY